MLELSTKVLYEACQHRHSAIHCCGGLGGGLTLCLTRYRTGKMRFGDSQAHTRYVYAARGQTLVSYIGRLYYDDEPECVFKKELTKVVSPYIRQVSADMQVLTDMGFTLDGAHTARMEITTQNAQGGHEHWRIVLRRALRSESRESSDQSITDADIDYLCRGVWICGDMRQRHLSGNMASAALDVIRDLFTSTYKEAYGVRSVDRTTLFQLLPPSVRDAVIMHEGLVL